MSQPFEQTDVAAAAVAGGVAATARSVLSDEFVNSNKNPVSGDKAPSTAPSDSPRAAATVGESIAQGIKDAINSKKHTESGDSSPTPSVGSRIADVLNGIDKAGDRSPMPIEKGGRVFEHMDQSIKYFDKTVTDKQRNTAKEALGQGLSELIPEGDRKLLQTMQGALIDGDLEKLKGSLGSLSGDPDKMEKFIKELNGQLKREGAGIELTADGKGNVLVYEKGGNTAVSINAKTGETTLRAIERQNDGSVLLKPGEIINRKPAEVMKNIGDEATRGITGMNFKPYYEHSWKEYLNNSVPRSGGGGGGGENSMLKEAIKSIENTLPKVKKTDK